MKPLRLLLALIGLFLVLVAGTFALTGPAPAPQADLRTTAELQGSGALDGKTFKSKLGPLGQPADVEDTLVFANGLFLSSECERLCNFPARPYFVRNKNDGIEFISETRCPNKEATLVWRGTIENDVIKGEFTWVSSRWYWTYEQTFWFEGVLSDEATSTKNS
jgi:hypothetical protein